MGMLLNSMRGIYILTPRNMVQAAGMYNTLIQADDPAIMIECLNGYRKKEILPDNIGKYTVPLGVPEIIKKGEEVTIVSYGSTLDVVEDAAVHLEKQGISCEIIDIQTLLPFDLEHRIFESLKKTNKLVVVDEDVPGGASAFILQKILEEQKGYYFLDRPPLTITAKEHRAAYADNGDYMSKPNMMEILKGVYNLVNEEYMPSY
jgi:pyruvate/2-oxoglutarate/acetoin dehydrogenase E1 component